MKIQAAKMIEAEGRTAFRTSDSSKFRAGNTAVLPTFRRQRRSSTPFEPNRPPVVARQRRREMVGEPARWHRGASLTRTASIPARSKDDAPPRPVPSVTLSDIFPRAGTASFVLRSDPAFGSEMMLPRAFPDGAARDGARRRASGAW